MFSIRHFGRDILKYRTAMMIALIIFAAGAFVGASNVKSIAGLIMPEIERLGEHSRNLAASDNPELSFFLFIFANNAIKSVAIMLLGALLGVIPFFFLLMNGLILGFVVAYAGSGGTNVLEMIVRGLLPHGIIEIPAILLAAGFGMQFGYLALKSLGELGARDASDRTVKWREFFVSLGRGAVWIVILLLVAAIVESTLTFYLMGGTSS